MICEHADKHLAKLKVISDRMALSMCLLAAIAALGTVAALEGPNVCTRQET